MLCSKLWADNNGAVGYANGAVGYASKAARFMTAGHHLLLVAPSGAKIRSWCRTNKSQTDSRFAILLENCRQLFPRIFHHVHEMQPLAEIWLWAPAAECERGKSARRAALMI